MNINEYQNWTIQTAIYPEAGTGSNLELSYLALGLTSEAGEVAGKVKKYVRDLAWDKDAVIAELGDVFWYLARMCDEMDIDAEEVLQLNYDKLESRKARGTIQGNGDNR